jgi:hypothetical protein
MVDVLIWSALTYLFLTSIDEKKPVKSARRKR